MVWSRSDSVSRLQGRDVEGVRGGWVRPNWVKLEPNQDGLEAAVSKYSLKYSGYPGLWGSWKP